jgi:beta-lactamase class D
MNRIRLIALVALLALGKGIASADTWQERPEWTRYFAEAGIAGTIVVVDERTTPGSQWAHAADRARTRYLPASTFKIPHALFALDAGVVRDEFQVFRWDGERRDIES